MSGGQAAGCAAGGGGGGKEKLSAIGRMILESQTLDGGGEELSAYKSYLQTVQYISQYMAADIMTNQGRGSLPKEKAEKLFKMAKHCLERSEEMYVSAQDEGRGLASRDTVTEVAPSLQQQQSTTIPIPTPTPTLSVPTTTGQAQSVPSTSSVSPSTATVRPYHSVGTSYMREARLRNQYMMDQYRAHLRSQMKPRSQEMGLSMLRRLEENISVAKIRQQNLARKARERQLRLQQSDSKTVSRRAQVVRLSQLSVEELREQVVSFEHGKHLPILTALKNKLTEGHERLENFKNRLGSHSPQTPSSPTPPTPPTNTSTATEVYNFVNEILSNPDHPLSRLLGEYQLEIFTLLKPLQLAREKAGDTPTLCISPKVGNTQSNCQSEDGAKLQSVSSPPQPPLHPTPNHFTSSHPPTLTSSHPPTLTSSHPPTVTVQGTSLDREPGHLELLYMNDESENGDDDLFTLSNADFSPPGDRNFNGNQEPLAWASEDDDTLRRLRAELEGSVCEDGGRCVTQVHAVMGEEEEEEEGEGGEESWVVDGGSLLHAVGEEGESGGCCDGGVFVSRAHTVEERGCVDGGRCVIQLHTPAEDEEGDNKDNMPTQSDKTTPPQYSETTHPQFGRVYTDTDGLEEASQAPLLPPQDLTDGGMLSRPHPLPEEEEEEEEEVMFPGLVPLSCRCYYGNDEEMKSLKATAEPILAEAVGMIHSYLNKLEQLFTSCYPMLSSPTERGECQSVLESLFFPALLPSLLAAYRCKTYTEELASALNMCRHVNATPKDLDVRRKFWLQDEPTAPYNDAIVELCRVRDLHYPSGKLTCLVSTSRLVVKCIDDYYEAQGQPKGSMDSGVGVDDILPIMSYIIIRSRLPQLVSETAIMEEFIQDEYVKGEEGFCLTSFMTALKFVSCMSS